MASNQVEFTYKPEQEFELIRDISTFRYDPLGYVLYNYPWGVEGTPLEHDEPRKWQIDVLQDVKAFVVEQQFALDNDMPLDIFREAIVSGRGPGKSALFGWLTQWMLDCHIGATVIVTANTEKQVRTKSFPEFGKWFTLSMTSHWWDTDSMAIRPKSWIKQLVESQLKINTEYWTAQGQNWSEENPDAFAGTHNTAGLAVFFDEASGIPEPIWTVTHGFFTERTPFRLWLAFSQGRRNNGAFYNRFHNSAFSAWRTRRLNVLEVEGVDTSVHKAIIEEHGEDSDQARVEVYGEFPKQGDNQLIANDVVRGAQQRDVRPLRDESQPLIMGVDPAPRGRTAIRFRQGRDGRTIPPVVLNGANNTTIAQKVSNLATQFEVDAIVVDAGQGTGVIDELKRRRVRPVFEVWFGSEAEEKREFGLLGAELWGKMRDWLPGAAIDDSQTLFRDLTARTWEWHGREEAKKKLTSKRDMEREGIPSPDDGDALALTFYPRIPRRNSRVHAGQAMQGQMAQGLDETLI